MTTVIIPTRHPPLETEVCLDVLSWGQNRPDRTILVVDARQDTQQRVQGRCDIDLIVNSTQAGYWGSLNVALATVPMDEPFCYVAVDVIFYPDWLPPAEGMYAERFPNGLGLLAFWDGFHDGDNASHGMTTRKWLDVVYGEPFFTGVFEHYFLDSELTVRSRDLRRYAYCPDSKVAHIVNSFVANDPADNDRAIRDQRHDEWHSGDHQAARERLARYRRNSSG